VGADSKTLKHGGDPAYSALAYDLMMDVLAVGAKPARMTRRVVELLRELTGARLVVLVRCVIARSGGPVHEVAAFVPARRRDQAEGTVVEGLAARAVDMNGPTLERDAAVLGGQMDASGGPSQTLIVTPLRAGERHVGALIVVGLPDEHSIDQVIAMLDLLSRVLGLLLSRASVLGDQEAEIASRTRALAESQETLRILLRSIGDSVVATDVEGSVTFINPPGEALTGWTAEEAIGSPLSDVCPIIDEETGGVIEDPVRRALRERRVVHLADDQALLVARDGTRRPISENAAPIRDADGWVTGAVLVLHDQTRERATRTALRESEERFRSLAQAASDAIVTADVEGRIQFFNAAAERMFGYSYQDVLGRDVTLLIPDEFKQKHLSAFERYIRGGRTNLLGRAAEFVGVRREGRCFPVEVTVSEFRSGGERMFIGILRDLTVRKEAEAERKRLETALRRRQALDSIGALAGGVAHDLNNLLSPILGYADFLSDELDADDPRRESVAQIIRAGFGARDLVRQLLAFSSRQPLEYEPVDLGEAVNAFKRLLRRTIREDIDIQITGSTGEALVMADIGQIEQVVLNLVINAGQAMPEGGRLGIEIGVTTLDELRCAAYGGLPLGRYVTLAVSDTGAGIEEEVREHIFEPFFSTKDGMGTGLGLATVYGIVNQHEGAIDVESVAGEGTTFHVVLPVAEGAVPRVDQPAPTPEPVMGAHTILLVEDNAQVRDLTETILQREGYTVLVAEGGMQALTRLESHVDPVHLLLTDVIMPDMNGKALFEAVSDLRPGIKVLYMSGYTADVIGAKGALDEGIDFIHKPFTVKDLAAKVSGVLARA